MDNFVDIWKIFNFAFFDFVIVYKLFWQKIEIPIKDMQGKFTFVKINEKNMCFGEKDIPIWWSFIFAEGPFLAKSDLASTISSYTMERKLCLQKITKSNCTLF